MGSYEEGPTGVTIIRFPKRATVAVDSRGGAPGTVNTDLLRLGYSRAFIDAIVFSGGSAYGEETITAVSTGLKDEGVRSGDLRYVAIVPGAIIYDFGGRRLNEIYPDKRLAQAALQAMRPGVFPLVAQGAGRMAMQGGMARAIQPFSTEAGGDTLYAASTQEVDNKDISRVALATIAGETMWDAVLASVPDEAPFVPPAAPATVSVNTLAGYAGTYEFAPVPEAAGGALSGLGLDVAIEDGLVTVSPMEGAPAARAGVMAGDIVTRLDGTPLKGITLDQLLDKLRGASGSKAELTITRKGEDRSVDITIVREPIRLRSLLRVRVQGDGLVVEAIGGRQFFEFQRAKAVAVIPYSDAEDPSADNRSIWTAGLRPACGRDGRVPGIGVYLSQFDNSLTGPEFYVDGRYQTRIAFTKDAAGKVLDAVLNPGRWQQKGVKID